MLRPCHIKVKALGGTGHLFPTSQVPMHLSCNRTNEITCITIKRSETRGARGRERERERLYMAILGILEVYLIAGKGMKNVEFLGKNDPYAILSYKTQDQKSKTLEDGGSDPVWKQKFFFEVDDEEIAEVIIKVFDEDKRTADDAIGETRIPLGKVLEELEVPATLYDLMRPSGRTHGQVEVALKFAPKAAKPPPPAGKHQNGHGSHHAGPYGENNEGGWQ